MSPVGAGGLILIDDCADPFSVEAVRASMGAIFTQKLVEVGICPDDLCVPGPPGEEDFVRLRSGMRILSKKSG